MRTRITGPPVVLRTIMGEFISVHDNRTRIGSKLPIMGEFIYLSIYLICLSIHPAMLKIDIYVAFRPKLDNRSIYLSINCVWMDRWMYEREERATETSHFNGPYLYISHLSFYPFIYLFICPCIYLSIYLSAIW